jgi:tetratricopeptide (TPR) repeat protein
MIPGGTESSSTRVTTPVIPEHELLRPIASGSYGEVWLARSALGAYRAVKIVRRSSFDHDRPFEREFAGLKAFEPISRGHENLIDLLQVGRTDQEGYFYYVMELADDATQNPKSAPRSPKENCGAETETGAQASGIRATGSGLPTGSDLRDSDFYQPRTLRRELATRGKMPLEECIELGLAVCGALAFLHKQRLVHRDIKPSNILFVGGVAKLADVGLVANLAEALSYVGTEGFIPPEGPGKPQADLYSLGIVLYVMSTGKSHQDFPEPLADLASQPDHARWLEFNSIIHKACRVDVRERFQSAEDMRDELALMQRGHSVKRKRAVQRRWTIARALGLAAIAVALLIAALPFLKGAKPGHTPDPEAERQYELGRWYYNKLTLEDHKKAIDHLNRAVRIDPKFVEPYAQLTAIYVWGIAGLPSTSSDQERLQKTKEITAKLMAIDPGLGEAHTALSWCKFLQRDWRGAEDEIVRAIKLNPKFPIARDIYGFYLCMLGRGEEAERQLQRSQELDPSARTTTMVAAWPFMAERRFDRAIAQLRRVVDLDKNFPQAHNFLGRCYEAQSNYVAAIEEYKTSDLLSGLDSARVTGSYAALRQAYDALGEQGYFRKWIELTHADDSLPEEQKSFSERDIAGCYARLGDKQKALDEIEKHFDEPGWQQLKFEPLYDSLHDEPRFKALLKRAGFEK